MAKIQVSTKINNENVDYLCEPHDTMLDVLRNQLELTGSKESCGSGDCGSCSIILDGELVCSCLMLAAEAEGSNLETIEGMSEGGKLHALQQKFLEFIECLFLYKYNDFISPLKKIYGMMLFSQDKW